MTKWLPIETAPKDGTNILITDGVSIESVEYCNFSKGWIGTYYDGYSFTYDNGEPTHWMPLPELP